MLLQSPVQPRRCLLPPLSLPFSLSIIPTDTPCNALDNIRQGNLHRHLDQRSNRRSQCLVTLCPESGHRNGNSQLKVVARGPKTLGPQRACRPNLQAHQMQVERSSNLTLPDHLINPTPFQHIQFTSTVPVLSITRSFGWW